MTEIDYIALSIPVFFALIGVEMWFARKHERKLYRFNDAINDLNCGILQQVLGVFTKAFVFGAYVLLFSSVHLVEIGADSIFAWLICFLGVDFFYYWFHRVSHESSLPWGAHVVHHSSEEYNLAVALRQGAFQPLFSWIFYLPLAVIGFPPLMFLACTSFNTLYQFWIHTRTIGRLGAFEWVFNTPSHHRVHHGCDEKYLDKNYGGTLIVWDRLFGSFQLEEEEPTYGIIKPLASWNPLWANLHHYDDIWRVCRQAPSLWQAAKVWLKPPGWNPEWADTSYRTSHSRTPLTDGEAGKFDAHAPRSLAGYIFIHFLGLLAMSIFLLHARATLETPEKVALAILAAWTATNLGAIFERRRWVLVSELSRLAVVWSTIFYLFAATGTSAKSADQIVFVAITGALTAGLFAAWLLSQRNAFQKLGTVEPREIS